MTEPPEDRRDFPPPGSGDPAPHRDPGSQGPPPPPPMPPPYGQPYYGGPVPPYGGYGPYGPPQPYASPEGITAPDDTTWALLGYLGTFVISFIAPLIVYLARKDRSPFVRFHGAQALNLMITYFILFIGWIVVTIPLAIVTKGIALAVLYPALLAWGITNLVFLIIAAVKSGQRQLYRIPTWLCWPMVK